MPKASLISFRQRLGMGRGIVVLVMGVGGTMAGHLGRRMEPREWFYSVAFILLAIRNLHLPKPPRT
jgi:hypothetical protein